MSSGERFELIDGIEHQSTKYPVSIEYMKLSIEANLYGGKINCIEDLELMSVDDTQY
jgi:hypothetical protein